MIVIVMRIKMILYATPVHSGEKTTLFVIPDLQEASCPAIKIFCVDKLFFKIECNPIYAINKFDMLSEYSVNATPD